VAWLLLVLGTAAGALMIATEFSTISEVRLSSIAGCDQLPVTTPSNVRDACSLSGHQHHHWALLILGVVTIVMTLGLVLGRSTPAAIALIAIGLAVLVVIALIIDRPTIDDTRGLDVIFQHPRGVAGSGFHLELIAGALAVMTGLVQLVFVRPRELAAA
jgi:hypothetical protein